MKHGAMTTACWLGLCLGMAYLRPSVGAGAPALATQGPGIAYQTWNKPLGVWQNAAQIDFDLAEMARIGTQTVRVEFVWNVIEPEMDRFDFTLPDLLVQAAERHGIKLYPIIGFQWPPAWMAPEHRLASWGTPPKVSSLMNYADPFVRERFQRVITEVVSHFRGNRTIAAWILGNEFAYVDFSAAWILGNEFAYVDFSGFEQLGYDALSRRQFALWLKQTYRGREAEFERRWGTPLTTVDTLDPSQWVIRQDGDVLRAPVIDFLDFRRRAVASVIGDACVAAKRADPGARTTYSSIGVLFLPYDRAPLSEDPALIAAECARRKAPLDFWSINAYLNLNHEESFHLGLAYQLAKAITGLPVIFTEFGLTSTEQYAEVNLSRQGPFLRAQVLQSLFDKVPQAHVFTWMDKRIVSERERGFGIRTRTRKAKPAFEVLEQTARALAPIDLSSLQKRIIAPQARVAMLLPDPEVGFVQWNSWLNQAWLAASYLMRDDVPLAFLDPRDLDHPDRIKDVDVVLLSRQGMLGNRFLARMVELVRKGSFDVVSWSDLPGMDREDEDRSVREGLWADLFGIRHIETIGREQAPVLLYPELPHRASVAVLPRLHRIEALPGLAQTSDTLRAHYEVMGQGRTNSAPKTTSLFFSRRFDQRSAALIPIWFEHLPISPKNIAAFRSEHDRKRRDSSDRFLDYENDWFAQFLREVLVTQLGHGDLVLAPAQTAAVARALPLVQTRALDGGGHLVLLQAMPPMRAEPEQHRMGRPCPSWLQPLTVSGLAPSERLVSLMTREVATADRNGTLRTERSACGSDLLVTEAVYREITRPAAPFPPPAPSTERRRVFPGVAFLDSRVADPCVRAAFERTGFRATAQIEAWQEGLERWLVTDQDIAQKGWRDTYTTLILPPWPRLQRTEVREILAFLASDSDRRVFTSAYGFVDRLATWLNWLPVSDQIRLIEPGCRDLSPETLESMVFKEP